MLGDVGRLQLLRGAHQHARHVERHVAHPHHGGAAGGEGKVGVHVGVAVVPGHELGRAERSRQVLAGDPHGAVGERAGGEHHGVVQPPHIGEGQIGPELHVAQEPDPWILRDALERPGDPLDTGVIGRHAMTEEAVGHGQAVDQIHDHAAPGLVVGIAPVQQCLAGVDTGRAGPDHGHTERRT